MQALTVNRIHQSLAAPLFLTVVLLAAPGTHPAADFYHTVGSRIVDSHGSTVKLAGVSWWGLETENFAPLGLDKRSMDSILAEVRGMGFNTLRIPFSNAMLHGQATPQGINYAINPELRGMSPLQIMDAMIAGARAHGLRVILDRHRPDDKLQSDLWYTPDHPESEWIADWKMLAARYRNNDTVVGFDLHNEPHGKATWGTGDAAVNGDHPTDWRLAAERAGNAVLAINPHLLILVEGVSDAGNGPTPGTSAKDTYWWGGNLSQAAQYPVRLTRPGQLVYSAHDYPPSVADQSWFKDASFPNNLTAVWQRHWGYLVQQGKVPVVLGEFGTHYSTEADREWMQRLVQYVAANNISAMYWSLNPESADTGGLLQQDWQTVDTAKLEALKPIMPVHVRYAAAPQAAVAPATAARASAQPVAPQAPPSKPVAMAAVPIQTTLSPMEQAQMQAAQANAAAKKPRRAGNPAD